MIIDSLYVQTGVIEFDLKSNDTNEVFNFLVFLRGMPVNDSVCEDICTLAKSPFPEMNSINDITIPKWTLHYFRCYKYDYGNNEKASMITTTGTDVDCTGRMKHFQAVLFRNMENESDFLSLNGYLK